MKQWGPAGAGGPSRHSHVHPGPGRPATAGAAAQLRECSDGDGHDDRGHPRCGRTPRPGEPMAFHFENFSEAAR